MPRKTPGMAFWEFPGRVVPGLACFGRVNWSATDQPLPRHTHPGLLEFDCAAPLANAAALIAAVERWH